MADEVPHAPEPSFDWGAAPPEPERLGCSGIVRRFPVTVGLTVVTATFYFLEWALGGTTSMASQFRLGALRGDLVWQRGEWYRLVGAVFIHHGWFHFGVNWLAFLQLGALVEYVYGSRRLLVFYLLSGLGGSLASSIFMHAPGGTRGSSGAIFGLAAVCIHLLGRYRETVDATMIDAERGRRQLGVCVAFMFVLGIGLAAIGWGVIDNYGHGGGFLTGLACAWLAGDPRKPPGRVVDALALGLSAFTLAAFVAIGLYGGRSADAIHAVDLLYSGADRVEQYRAGRDPAAGLATFRADVAAVDSTGVLDALQGELYVQRFDREAAIVADRWIALAPNDPSALNARAWIYVTTLDERRRPDLALPLVDQALALAAKQPAPMKQAMRAGFLDTRAEALYQLGRYREALAAEREAVPLMKRLRDAASSPIGELLSKLGDWLSTWRYGERGESDPLPDMRRRLDKIERAVAASGAADVAPADSG